MRSTYKTKWTILFNSSQTVHFRSAHISLLLFLFCFALMKQKKNVTIWSGWYAIIQVNLWSNRCAFPTTWKIKNKTHQITVQPKSLWLKKWFIFLLLCSFILFQIHVFFNHKKMKTLWKKWNFSYFKAVDFFFRVSSWIITVCVNLFRVRNEGYRNLWLIRIFFLFAMKHKKKM